MAEANKPATAITLTPAFKLIFLSVMFLTIVFLSISCFMTLAVAHPQSEEVRSLGDKCATAWQMGFGAIVGLIGGKVV